MPGEVLLALAQFAGQTVAAAAVTDAWETARRKFAQLLGRGDARKTVVAQRWLTETHEQLAGATPAELTVVTEAQAQRWQSRFADLLDEDPDVAADLRALVEEIAAGLPASIVSAADHSIAAGGNVNISATSSGIAAGVIHGDVSTANPQVPGPRKG